MLTAVGKISLRRIDIVSWWLLVLMVGALALGVYSLFRWAGADPGIDEGIAREQFRAEQDWRSARRAGDTPAAADARERLQKVR